MHSQQSTVRTPSAPPPRTPLASAVAHRFNVLSARRDRARVQRRQELLAQLDLDQRVRETGEW